MPELKNSTEPVLLDIRAGGALLGLTYWRMYALIKAGAFPVLDVGGKFYMRRATLLRWVEKSEGKYKVAA